MPEGLPVTPNITTPSPTIIGVSTGRDVNSTGFEYMLCRWGQFLGIFYLYESIFGKNKFVEKLKTWKKAEF